MNNSVCKQRLPCAVALEPAPGHGLAQRSGLEISPKVASLKLGAVASSGLVSHIHDDGAKSRSVRCARVNTGVFLA
jgi:hypothetical protein